MKTTETWEVQASHLVEATEGTPESWLCVDCSFNTAPGFPNKVELHRAIAKDGRSKVTIDNQSEVYTVRDVVWKRAGMEPLGGCLCIGCLEKRLDRRLKPKDFQRGRVFNQMPGTARLLNRRKRDG